MARLRPSSPHWKWGLLTTLFALGGCPLTGLVSSSGETAQDQAGGTFVNKNRAPVASAGNDQTVVAGTVVVLDGTQSADPDGDQLMYFWRQADGADDLELQGGFSAVARFTAPQVAAETTLTFRLIIVDGRAVQADDVNVTIRP